MGNLPPTKGNLIASKRSLALATNGYELMDKKRNILVRELMGLIEKATELQNRIDETFSNAYSALGRANVKMGGCEEIAKAVPLENGIKIRYRSVMGVTLPSVSCAEKKSELPPYGFTNTGEALDEAYINFQKVKKLTLELAELENSIYRLAFSIKKAQKRANALNNIVIPEQNANIIKISTELEEKEREEFVRLKVIKAQKS